MNSEFFLVSLFFCKICLKNLHNTVTVDNFGWELLLFLFFFCFFVFCPLYIPMSHQQHVERFHWHFHLFASTRKTWIVEARSWKLFYVQLHLQEPCPPSRMYQVDRRPVPSQVSPSQLAPSRKISGPSRQLWCNDHYYIEYFHSAPIMNQEYSIQFQWVSIEF